MLSKILSCAFGGPSAGGGWRHDVRLLVIEDDPELGSWLRTTLEDAFGGADLVTSLDEAQAAVKVREFDLIVMDRRLPDGDSIELIGAFQRLRPRPSLLVLTALDDPNHIAKALDAGADDYLAKPFEPVELIARVRAVMRRAQLDQSDGVVTVANLRFCTAARTAYIEGTSLILPRRELALLEALIRRVGQVVLRETLENAAYGFDDEIQSNAIDAHLSRLRKRLREHNCQAQIRPLRGLGYMLSEH